MELPDRGQAKSWEGREVLDVDGEPLGTCVGVFADSDTGVTEWLQLDVTDRGRSFVPALDATDVDGSVRVRFTAVAVRSAPRIEGGAELSQAEERSLYDHYGVPVSKQDTDSLLPADATVADSEPEPAPAAPEPAPAAAAAPPAAPAVAAAPATAATSATASPPPPAPSPQPEVEPVPEVEQVVAPEPEPVLTSQPRPEFALEVGRGGGTAAILAPLAAVAGLAAAVWVVLRGLQARSRRKQPTARASRLASNLQGSASALAGRSARQLADTASSTSKAAAQGRKDATKAAAQARKDATKTAAKRRKETAKAAAKRRKETTKAAARGRKQATSAVSSAADAVSSAADAASRRGQAVARGTAAVPGRAAKKGRKAKRSVARNLWQALLLAVGGTGYVFGAKAGEERYEQIEQQASQLASRPEVQQVADKVRGQVS